MVRLAAALFVVAWAAAGRAEMVRCEDAAGRLRFTDDPSRCAAAEAYTPDPGRLQRAPVRAPAQAAGRVADLAALLPAAPPGWEAIPEALDVERDPELRAGGLLASVARHFGRAVGPVSHLCTVELWSFASAGQARVVQASLGSSGDGSRVVGPLLVLARSVRMERGAGTSRALTGECRALAASVDGAPSRR